MSIQEAYELGGRIPDPIDSLSVGLQVTGIGLIIVFAVLIILMVVLVAMRYIFAPKTKKEEALAVKTQEVKTETVSPGAEPEDEELIAVLTAAIAASLNTSTYNLKIKSFRRVGNNAPAWNRAGLNETINSRF